MVKSTRSEYAAPVPGTTIPLALLISFLLLFVGSCPPPCTGSSGPSAAEMMAAARGACAARGRRCPWEAAGEQTEAAASRKALQEIAQRYISYEFLKADAVPCSRPGLPYYNCHALTKANPYSRGCLTITRCARDAGP
ncbi:hypothetical protein Taro_013909 [Colocasia esculenta]|uniref:Uncharacterized protein n=1 Tax=Colocasia esculenta TaxID=4460 RepID=A0A843UHT5_COLES|nr:hypothetical protein [Colocasia esculenta]